VTHHLLFKEPYSSAQLMGRLYFWTKLLSKSMEGIFHLYLVEWNTELTQPVWGQGNLAAV
jgi:hypothetical protein